MKNKAIFITLIVFMIGAIVLGVVAKNKMLDTVAQNKAYVDKYVENLDDSFVFRNEETISETEKKFYYTSPKYPSFTLVVTSNTSGEGYVITDNYSSLNMNFQIFEYFKNFFGEDVLVNIMNLGELNVLPTIEEAIDYNYFNIAVGILENEDIENQIAGYKTKLTQNKIDCNIYFYYLTQEQYDRYTEQFVVVDAGFVNYQMCIVENGKITTEIRYE